jgi:hypothetical protein
MVPARMDASGLTGPTRGEAYGPQWRATSHGLFVPATADALSVEQRIVEAAAVLPPDGAVTGWAALRWMGAMWFSGALGDGVSQRPVTVLTGCGAIRSQHGIIVSSEQRRHGDIVEVDGLMVTLPVRSTLFEVRYAASPEQAVVAADMAMQADLVSRDELLAYASTLGTWTGIPLAREALPWSDENSWSPQETRMRLAWCMLVGLPRPLCNAPVFDLAGRHVGTPDLIDPVVGVVGEYEGVVHLSAGQRGRDVRREQAFRDLGLEYFSVVGSDWADETVLAARMRSAYARAVSIPGRRRLWTTEPPHWWVRTDSVARRRALSEDEQRRLLRYRAG